MRMEQLLSARLIFFFSHNPPTVPKVRFLNYRPNSREVTGRTVFGLLFCAQRANVRDKRMYLILAE